MPFVGLDPDRLTRLDRRLQVIVDSLMRLTAGWDDDVAYELRRRALDCGEARRRIAELLIHVRLLEVKRSSTEVQELVESNAVWWLDPTTNSDVVDRALVTEPGRLIDTLDSDAALAALVFGTDDSGAVRRFWLAATDPRFVSEEVARSRVLKLVDVVVNRDWQTYVAGHVEVGDRHHRIEQSAIVLAAEVAAAWQFHFLGLAERWSLDPIAGRDMLAALADHEDAAAALLRGLPDVVWRELAAAPDDDRERWKLIDDVAFSVGAATEIVRRSEVDRATSADHTMSDLLHLPLVAPVPLPRVASDVIGVGADLASRALATEDDVARAAAVAELGQRDLLAAVAVAALWTNALDRARGRDRGAATASRSRELELQHARDSISNAAGRGDAFVNS